MASAMELVQRGYRVFAGYRNREKAQPLFECKLTDLIPVELDVTQPDTIAAAVELVKQQYSEVGLSGLINNAGYAFACPLEFLPLDQFRQQLETNVVGQLAMMQQCVPLLRSAQGRVINIGSISGHVAGPYVGPYAASKHAFAALNDSMRLELRHFGIRVVQIIPADIQTAIWEKSRKRADELRDQMAEDINPHLPEQVRENYAADGQAMREATEKFARAALPVSRVVKQVVRAMTAKRPRSHYLVGGRAWGAVRVLRFLPSRLRDRIILKQLGMKS